MESGDFGIEVRRSKVRLGCARLGCARRMADFPRLGEFACKDIPRTARKLGCFLHFLHFPTDRRLGSLTGSRWNLAILPNLWPIIGIK